MIDIRKDNGIKFVNLHSARPDRIEMITLQRPVVRRIAEGIEDGSHLYPMLSLVHKKFEEAAGNGVVAEIEIFKMDAAARLPDGSKEVVKLRLPISKQSDGIVMAEGHAVLTQKTDQCAVGPLRTAKGTHHEHQDKRSLFKSKSSSPRKANHAGIMVDDTEQMVFLCQPRGQCEF